MTTEASAPARATAGRSTSLRVVEAVADEKGVDPTTLDPLYQAINPDSLDALFPAEKAHRSEATGPSITFTFAGHRVSVEGANMIDVTELGERVTAPERPAGRTDEATQQTD